LAGRAQREEGTGQLSSGRRRAAGRSRSQPRLPRGETRAERRGGLQRRGAAAAGSGAGRHCDTGHGRTATAAPQQAARA